MLYILYGENSYSRHYFLSQIKIDLGIQDNEAITLVGAQLEPAHLSNTVNTIPFLTSSRLVIVEGLLGRFEPRKTSTKTAPKDLQAFITAANPLIPTTTLVIDDDKVSPQNPLLNALAPVSTIKHFPILKKDQLQTWITAQVTKRGGLIMPAAVNSLINLVGPNLWGLSSEIDKLLEYSMGKPIQETHIQRVVVLAKEANIFHLVDALLQRRSSIAISLLHLLITQGMTPGHLIGLVARQFRHLIIAKELLSQKVTERDVQRRLGLQDFAFRSLLVQAREYSIPQLILAYRSLLNTDLAIKTGKEDEDVAMDLFVADMCKADNTTKASILSRI